MGEFEKKAKDYLIVGKIAYELKKYDVSCSNYFKSLSALGDYLLESKDLFAKDHSSRFSLLKDNFYEVYVISSSLFLVYRRAYTKEITRDEVLDLYEKLLEVFEIAKIKIE